jgi:hypothetical protein
MLCLSTGKGQKNRVELLPVLKIGMQVPLYQENSDKLWLLLETIILEENFIHIYVLNQNFLVFTRFMYSTVHNCINLSAPEFF